MPKKKLSRAEVPENRPWRATAGRERLSEGNGLLLTPSNLSVSVGERARVRYRAVALSGSEF